MTDFPHFSIPFRVEGARAVVVEQDSTDDVVACVLAILLCPKGYRAELPEFGLEDPTFTEGAPDIDAIARAISEWEPRADTILATDRDALDELVAHVALYIGTRSSD